MEDQNSYAMEDQKFYTMDDPNYYAMENQNSHAMEDQNSYTMEDQNSHATAVYTSSVCALCRHRQHPPPHTHLVQAGYYLAYTMEAHHSCLSLQTHALAKRAFSPLSHTYLTQQEH